MTTTPNRSHVSLRLSIDQHGTTPVSLVCEFEDDGEASVPADLIAELIQYGVTGFPNADLIRETADKADMGPGCVDFKLQSVATPVIRVEGFTFCTNNNMCPTGQTCNTLLEVCQ